MNYKLIERVIKCNVEESPTFAFENPLLDKEVAGLLAKSLLKILKVSSQNSDGNNKLRLSVLENIRKFCKFEPENHIKVDDKFTELLTESYESSFKDINKTSDETNKLLEAFVLRKLNGADINIYVNTSINPEIVQALYNLNENGSHLETLSENIIYWSMNTKSLNVLKNIWNNINIFDDSIPQSNIDDISLKMKDEIEKILLENCQLCLVNKSDNLETIFATNSNLMHLIKIAAVSPTCFQICISILNFMFINSNCSDYILNFVSTFLNYTKIHCRLVNISSLYPDHLKNVVILLDIDLNNISEPLKSVYVKSTKLYLKDLHDKCENDLILVLSHFQDWFDIYFESVEQ